jgi:hypothetical protein
MSDPNKWQPIETAPKDTPVLVWAYCYKASRFATFVAEQETNYGWDVCGATGYEWESSFNTPTHWMPLPPPPSREAP